MSTTFGIPIPRANVEFNQYSEDLDHYFEHIDDNEDTERLFAQVWFRSMGFCRWLNPLGALLLDDTKVYALDNGQQGVYTIGHIKQIMAKQEAPGENL